MIDREPFLGVSNERMVPLFRRVSDRQDEFGIWKGGINSLEGKIVAEGRILERISAVREVDDGPEVSPAPIFQQLSATFLAAHSKAETHKRALK